MWWEKIETGKLYCDLLNEKEIWLLIVHWKWDIWDTEQSEFAQYITSLEKYQMK